MIARMKKKCKKSIASKLVYFNSAIILLVFVGAFPFIGYINFSLSIKKENQMMNAYLINAINSVDNKLKDMARVSLVAYSDDRTQEIIKNWHYNNEKNRTYDDAYLKKLFINMITIRDDIEGIYIFDKNDLVFKYDSIGSSVQRNVNLSEHSWITKESSSGFLLNGCNLIVSKNTDFINKITRKNVFDNYYINMVRDVKSFSPNECIGYILLLSPISVIRETLENFLDSDSLYLLLDKDKNIICEPTGNHLGKHISKVEPGIMNLLYEGKNTFEYKFRSFAGIFKRKKCMVSYHESEYSGLILIIGKPLSIIYRDSILIIATISFILICTIITVILFTGINIRKCFKPIKLLSESMSNFHKENTNINLPVTTEDEVGELTNSFNLMINTINDLIIKEYETTIKLQDMELKKKRAELMYLRNQINPHFLYNTLDTIRFKALINGDTEVAEMIMQLVDFFRFSVGKNSCLVTIEHEINLIRAYLELMKYRYPDLESEFNVDGELNDIRIPNFVLQPLVENSLMHGLKRMNYKGTIKITVKRDLEKEHDIIIEISDNGVGVACMIQKHLDDAINTNNNDNAIMDEAKHIGIRNIQERLKLLYSEGYGIYYKDNEEGGVTAVIRLSEFITIKDID